MHRFLIKPNAIVDGVAPLDADEARHALNVLRLSDGAKVEAMDGQGRAWHGILRTDGSDAKIELNEELSSTDAPVRMTLYMGLPKGEKLELIAQKLCEIGAGRIVPVRMERCVAKILPDEAEKKLTRIRRIAAEAQKQSGRQTALEISDPIDMRQLTEAVALHEKTFLLWEKAHGYRLKDARNDWPELTDIAAIVGPEGGISTKEAESLVSEGALPISLGPRILRAETAAIVACAEILALWGDL